jgi:serine/arginine repetitive matrix protein 1
MASGFFRGTSLEQDSRWNGTAKLKKALKCAAILETKVNTSKVKLEVINKWISERITELLGFEDEIVIGLVVNTLSGTPKPDPKQMQLDLTGFLEKQTAGFMEELWTLLADAQQNVHGIPTAFVEKKKQELAAKERKVNVDNLSSLCYIAM